MSFYRFLNILLRSVLLNATLICCCFCLSLAADGNPFFFWNETDAARFLMFMYAAVNIMHWIMEILLLFFKAKDYDEPF